MSSVHENSWSWIEYLVETINKLAHDLVSSTTFDLSFHPINSVIDDELQQKLSDFFNDFIGLVAFDDFQLQLLKVFLFTFISTVALIFIVWHIYGPRISEQFMETSKKIHIFIFIFIYIHNIKLVQIIFVYKLAIVILYLFFRIFVSNINIIKMNISIYKSCFNMITHQN